MENTQETLMESVMKKLFKTYKLKKPYYDRYNNN